MEMETKTPTPTGIGIAKQLNSVSDTKGEKSKEETSSLVRKEDQSTKPHCSVENGASSEKQGVQQEESGELVKTLGNMGDTTISCALQKPPGGRQLQHPQGEESAGEEGMELVQVEQVEVGPGCI